MKYYKMIDNNTIVGAISSNDFIRYQAFNDCFLFCDETKGEYVAYNGALYRSTWMRPITMLQDYIEVTIVEITEEEYQILRAAIDNNETIVIDGEDDEPIEEEEEPSIELEFVRTSKINEMSMACRRTIEAGFDLALRGEAHHFSLTTQDQLNLISLSAMTQKQNLIPYHADGEECIFYTSDEINLIVETAANLKMYQTTYFNSLKNYINALDTIQAIAAIEYGIPIPDEYKSDALKMLEM